MDKFFHYLAETCGIVGVLAFVGTLGYQVYVWLHTGDWPDLALTVVVNDLPEAFSNWFYHPHSWQGLNTVVTLVFKLPIPFWLLFSFIALSWLFRRVRDAIRQAAHKSA